MAPNLWASLAAPAANANPSSTLITRAVTSRFHPSQTAGTSSQLSAGENHPLTARSSRPAAQCRAI